MAKFRSQKNAFITGEISPTAHGRTDLPQYANACKTLKNMIPLLSGGAYKRPGTMLFTSYSGSTDYAPRLIPFVASNEDEYLVILGKTVGSSYSYIKVVEQTAPGPAYSTVTNGTTTLEYKIATGSNGLQYDEINDVQYAQSVDVMYLVHPKYKPYKLVRTYSGPSGAVSSRLSAGSLFKIVPFDDSLTGASLRDAYPYRAQNTTTVTLQPSAASGSITLTASAAFFNSKHVGALFKIKHGSTIGCAKVTGFTSTTSVSADVVVTFGATTAELTWWESSWSDYRGWPRSVALFQQRIIYGGNYAEGDSLWLSKSFNYSEMSKAALTQSKAPGDGISTGPTGEDPFQLTIASAQLNYVQWLSSDKSLIVGTAGEEWVVDFQDTSKDVGFAADNCNAVRQTAYGSGYTQAVRTGNELIFTPLSGQEVRSLVFNQIQNNYQAEQIQLLFDEKPQAEISPSGSSRRKIKTMAWDESRKTLWCLDTRGNLFGLTRDRSLQINCWHTHQMGGHNASETGGLVGTGSSTTLDPAYSICSGSVISLAVLPNSSAGLSDVWLVVKRKINGTFCYHIERLMGGICPFTSAYDNQLPMENGNFYVDAAHVKYNDYPLPETYGKPSLTLLEGKAVKGTAYGASGIFTLNCGTVSSGTTSVASWPPLYGSTFFSIAIGLPYAAVVEPVRPEAGSQIGSAQGAIKRITEVFLRLYRTMSCKVGKDSASTEAIEFRSGDTPMNKSAELFTGDKRIHLNADYDRDGYVYVCSDEPLPFAIMSISSEGMTYD